MSSISTVLLLLTITGAALVIVSLIDQRQVRARLINQKLHQMKRRVSELEELSITIEPLLESNKISKVINDEVIEIVQSMLRISSNNSLFQITLEAAEQREATLRDPSQKAPTFRLMESDAAIARSQYGLAEAARVIRKRQATDHLQIAELDVLLQELSWANYMIKVTSNVGQGHKAINKGDLLRAIAYYRKALEVASEGGYKDQRKNQIVSEIDQILNNKRKVLSTNLMPETLYNPTNEAHAEAFSKAAEQFQDDIERSNTNPSEPP